MTRLIEQDNQPFSWGESMKVKGFTSAFLILTAAFLTPLNTKDRSLLKLYEQSVSLRGETDKKDKAVTYLGRFQFPSHMTNADTLRVYYKGRIVEVENGSFSLTENKKLQTFTIVAALLPPPSSNTIATIEVPDGVEYKSYTLFRTAAPSKEDRKCEEWHVEAVTGSKGFTIPSDALIVLVDPTLIESITVQSWYKDNFTLKLPTLVFKKDGNKKEFDKAYARSLLSSLDWDIFHKREKWETKKHKLGHSARKMLA